MYVNEVRLALHTARTPWYSQDHTGQGFYGLYLKCNHDLPGILVPDDGLIYIGKTESGFSYRDHFEPRSGHSGNCTARRSIGALLKGKLNLVAQPRSRHPDNIACTNFRFSEAGELRLSEWMKGALYVARVPFPGNVASAESLLIRQLEPPLNLTGWENPQGRLIRHMRKACAEEARQSTRLH